MTNPSRDVLITTTDGVAHRSVVRYLGPVFGEHVHAPGGLRGLADDVRHALDDRSSEYDSELLQGRVAAVRELRKHAGELRAHAVVAVHFDVQALRGGVLATLAQGTAVQLDRPADGGWVITPTGRGDHPIVEELRTGGSATLAELSSRMDTEVDWLDATLTSLEESGLVVMGEGGRWHPADDTEDGADDAGDGEDGDEEE
ncbi:MAG TPA: heavy metal-binding domain-containing protein [Euzebya sp.]|nr:heavy metal-binding domain-containing protein [Euzebya sp.]